jgi:mRNA interferase YafQ
MLKPSYSKQFERDLKKMLKQGKKGDKIKAMMRSLVNQEPLATKHKDHKLIGNYKGRRECHIEPDWLLIYKQTTETIIFERTGTHADLFK